MTDSALRIGLIQHIHTYKKAYKVTPMRARIFDRATEIRRCPSYGFPAEGGREAGRQTAAKLRRKWAAVKEGTATATIKRDWGARESAKKSAGENEWTVAFISLARNEMK